MYKCVCIKNSSIVLAFMEIRRVPLRKMLLQQLNMSNPEAWRTKYRILLSQHMCRKVLWASYAFCWSAQRPRTLQTVLRVSQELDALQKEVHQLQKAEKHEQQNGSQVAVSSLHDWFGRYGEPHRQSKPEEMARSYIMKPRRLPFLGTSNAVTLRKGHLIKWESSLWHRFGCTRAELIDCIEI